MTSQKLPPPAQRHRANWSELLPVLHSGKDFRQKAFLIPALVTAAAVAGLYTSWAEPRQYYLILGAYLCLSAWYVVYLISGHRGRGLASAIAAAIVLLIALTPLSIPYFFVFRSLLPGTIGSAGADGQSVTLVDRFIGMFFGAGLMEELWKATPALLCLGLAAHLAPRWRDRLELREPLDGILMGAAAGAAFAFFETLFQYVPQREAAWDQIAGAGAGHYAGLTLLIPRLLGLTAGHVAYSAYFGYFIGLAALLPRDRWRILLVGWISAALLHAVWNTLAGLHMGFMVVVGLGSFAMMAAAILRARRLSPNRAQNFATQLIGSVVAPHAGKAGATAAVAAMGRSVTSAAATSGAAAAARPTVLIRYGQQVLPLFEGRRLSVTDLPGIQSGAQGTMLAEVVRNPRNPAILGLRNWSSAPWRVTPAAGAPIQIQHGSAVKLATGTRITFGDGTPEAVVL